MSLYPLTCASPEEPQRKTPSAPIACAVAARVLSFYCTPLSPLSGHFSRTERGRGLAVAARVLSFCCTPLSM